MTNPAAPSATPTPEEVSRSLNANLEALERARETIEASLATTIQAEARVRRLGLREANHQVDSGSDALAEASRLQQESNEAFHQMREELATICTCIAVVKGELLRLNARLQTARTE